MLGYAQGDGYRIGFGECKGKVLPAGTPTSVAPPPTPSGATSGVPSYTLYGYWRSTSSWRVRIVMALKGLKYDYVAVDLSKLVGNTKPMSAVAGNSGLPDKNPMAQVPYLYVSPSILPPIRG